jgi:DNA-binding CsgD family transcriptional regulator
VARKTHSRSGDILAIVESAYALDPPSPTWGNRLLETTEEVLGGGVGGFACEFALQPSGDIRFDTGSVGSVGVPADMLTTILDGLAAAAVPWLGRYLVARRGAAICVLTSEADTGANLKYRAGLADRGVHDGVNLVAVDVNDRGFLLSLGVRPRYRLHAATRAALTRAATHILAALRLRARLAASVVGPWRGAAAGDDADAFETPEAILSPEGKLLDAVGEARETAARRALERAVRDVERARGSMRHQPLRALASWKGLVAARWTLLDHFDRGGRKYVVARENRPHATGPETLTHTERSALTYLSRGYSTKETAYALGISDTTVRVLMMRAARRCQVDSRRGLLDLWSRMGQPPAGKSQESAQGMPSGTTGGSRLGPGVPEKRQRRGHATSNRDRQP